MTDVITNDTSPENDTPTNPDDPEQTWTAHVANGVVIARVKTEDWKNYEKANNL